MLTKFVKDPEEIIRYGFDWSADATNDPITVSTWEVPDGIVATNTIVLEEGSIATIRLAEGSVGGQYRISNLVEFESGLKRKQSFMVVCVSK